MGGAARLVWKAACFALAGYFFWRLVDSAGWPVGLGVGAFALVNLAATVLLLRRLRREPEASRDAPGWEAQ